MQDELKELELIDKEVIKMGQEAYNIFQSEYNSMKSCKPHLFTDKYFDCIFEKKNCAYEFLLDERKKQDQKASNGFDEIVEEMEGQRASNRYNNISTHLVNKEERRPLDVLDDISIMTGVPLSLLHKEFNCRKLKEKPHHIYGDMIRVYGR